eukprot:TRINITY_DN2426_c0_g1_i1.p2 TRINITY_DN2426_c0_g1~~TRINITY_DN2426_c0_g1_i1.p2  ORF type:complete len:451 (+),score=108.19 TRINITY_DN2426_c0_g1_i1:31-1353(+)
MDSNSTVISKENENEKEYAQIPCYRCGKMIDPNPTFRCLVCLSRETDITEDIGKEYEIDYCKNCKRYRVPPKDWTRAKAESPQLLSILLKRVKGLKGLKLVDAEFVWTEPHSKHLEILIKVRKTVFGRAVLEQTCCLNYSIRDIMCDDCVKEGLNINWEAKVQVRQHSTVKKVLYLLELLIVKNPNILALVCNMEEQKDGVDFFFKTKSNGQKFVEFIKRNFPVKHERSAKLLSEDIKNATASMKYTHSVEIVPLCKNDLVWDRKSKSSFGEMYLVEASSHQVHFISPITGQKSMMSASKYFSSNLKTLRTYEEKYLESYLVIGKEIDENIMFLTVMLENQMDQGISHVVTTHLSPDEIECGDYVWGYSLESTFRDLEIEVDGVPDIILVKKVEEKQNLGLFDDVTVDDHPLLYMMAKQAEKFDISDLNDMIIDTLGSKL